MGGKTCVARLSLHNWKKYLRKPSLRASESQSLRFSESHQSQSLRVSESHQSLRFSEPQSPRVPQSQSLRVPKPQRLRVLESQSLRALSCTQHNLLSTPTHVSLLVCTWRKADFHLPQTGAPTLAPGGTYSGANDTWCYFSDLKIAPMQLRYWPKNCTNAIALLTEKLLV